MFPGMQQFTSGLLSDPFFNIGMGLLSSSGPSLDPGQVGIGRGMALGMQNMSRAQQAAMQQQAMRMQQEKFKREGERYRQQVQARETLAQEMPGLLSMVPENMRGPLGRMAQADPEKVLGLLTPYMKPPKVDKPATAIELYEFSKAQHVTAGGDPAQFPNFDTWNRNNKASGASSSKIIIPPGEKRISEADAKSLRMPGGGPVPVGMTYKEANAAGVVRITPEAQAGATDTTKRGAKVDQFKGVARTAFQAYMAAAKRYRDAPDVATKAAADSARKRLAISMAQVRNSEGEPSDSMISATESSLPQHFGFQQGIGSLTGSDPFSAQAKEIALELGIGGAQPRAAPPVDTSLPRQTVTTPEVDLQNMSTKDLLNLLGRKP